MHHIKNARTVGRSALLAAVGLPCCLLAGWVVVPAAAGPVGVGGEPEASSAPLAVWPPAATSSQARGESPGWVLRRQAGPSERAIVERALDRSEGGPVEVSGDRMARFEYLDCFAERSYREDATIEGASCVRWDAAAQTLELRGADYRRRVALVYHIVSPFTMKDIVGELAGEIQGAASDRVELALSQDGQAFGHAVGAFGRSGGNAFLLTTNASTEYHGRGFWMRIAADLSPDGVVRLTRFRAAGRTKPPGRPEVALAPAGDDRLVYRDDFRSRKVLHLAEIENDARLEWRRGRIGIAGRDGGPVRVALRQRFLSPEPLGGVVVRVRSAAGARGRNHFGLSLDGRTLLATQAAAGNGRGYEGTTELRLDDPSLLRGARQFYLHVVLSSQAGEPGNAISRIEVEARPTVSLTATAARRGRVE